MRGLVARHAMCYSVCAMDYFFLGSGELLTAFRFAGVDGTAVENREEALAAFVKETDMV